VRRRASSFRASPATRREPALGPGVIWFAFPGLALARPELATAQRTAYRLWRAALADALRERGHADPDADAAALIALVDGLSVQAAFEPRSFPSARLVELVDESLGSPSR
jgi:hypothetical protein